MAKTMTAPTAPPTRRLKILQDHTDDRVSFIAGQVADVPAALADELVGNGLATEAKGAPLRVPIWAVCWRCRSSWIHERILPDGRRVQRWTDDADQSPSWAQCRCGIGWLR